VSLGIAVWYKLGQEFFCTEFYRNGYQISLKMAPLRLCMVGIVEHLRLESDRRKSGV
jgi:hypothetical protein